MPEAGRLDYTVDRGGQLEDVLTWYADTARTQPVDLTGYTATLTVGTGNNTTPALVKQLVTGDAAGTVGIMLTDEETAALTEAAYLYDLRLESAEGLQSYLVAGIIHVMGRL